MKTGRYSCGRAPCQVQVPSLKSLVCNLPPLAALMPVDGEGLETAAGWRTFVEGQVERRQLPPLARDIVQRYFDAMMAETAE